MNKLGFLLLAALSAKSALAGEVGARSSQFAGRANLAVAVAEVGVSTSWTSAPLSEKAAADRSEYLHDLNEEISNQVSEDLERRIAQKLELKFAH